MYRQAEDLLLRSFRAWPSGVSARFMITPGGFLQSELPSGLSGRSGWNSVAGDFRLIQRAAESVVRRVVTPRVLKAAIGKADSLTIGIDLSDAAGIHAELVAFVRISDGKILRWTGKSYPTAFQASTLIQVVNLQSHCLRFEGDRVLILGCHDLNMFSPRGWSNQLPGGDRRKRCRSMRSLVSEFRPTVVLQHPHTTDSPRVWLLPWASLTKSCRTIHDWASGICFYNKGGVRSTLGKVTAATRGSEGLDFAFRTSRGGRILGPKVLKPLPFDPKRDLALGH
jgi:hypothetical protein